MSGAQTWSTADLRSAATENHRGDLDKRRKWAHGKAFGPGRDVENEAHARPGKPDTRTTPGMRRDSVPIATAKARFRNTRKQNINEYWESTDSSDSSAPEDVVEASAAPVPDGEITYSFDAARGPSHGSQILQLALDKAVERSEGVATDKLIKDEYEVLDNLDDEGEPVMKTKGKQKAVPEVVPAVDEDDWERV